MRSFYYLDPTEETVGPVSWDVLLQLHRAGAVSDETLTAEAGAGNWEPFVDLRFREERRKNLPPVPGGGAGAAAPTEIEEAVTRTNESRPGAQAPGAAASRVGDIVREKPIRWRWAFLLLAVISASMVAGSTYQLWEDGRESFLYMNSFAVLIVPGLVVMSVLHYQCWEALPPRFRATSPGKAVGFLFIPGFHIYWLFVSFPKLAEGILRWQRESGAERPVDARGLGVAYAVLEGVSVYGVFVSLPLVDIPLTLASLVVFGLFYARVVSVANHLMARSRGDREIESADDGALFWRPVAVPFLIGIGVVWGVANRALDSAESSRVAAL